MERTLNIGATLIYLGLVAFGLYHTLDVGTAWPGFTERVNNIEYALVPLWMLSIASLWSQRPWLWPMRFIGPFTALVHGMVLRFGGSGAGNIFIAAGLVLGFCTLRSHLEREVETSDLGQDQDRFEFRRAA